jgi:hypothetical protein
VNFKLREFPCRDNMWSTDNGEWTATIEEGKNGGSRFLCAETFYALVEE